MCFVTLQFTLQCAKHTVAVKVFTAAEANYIERVNEESTDLVSIWELCQSETCCNFTVIQSNLFKVYINLFTCAHTQPFQTVFLPTSDRLCNRHSCLCYLAEVFFFNLILEHDVKISTFHREKKLSRNCAIKVLNHAMTGVDGVDNSQKFVDILGLRTIFPLFMKTPKSSKAGPASDELEGMQHFFFFPLLITLNLCEKRKLMSLLSVWALRHTILRIKALFSRAYLFYHWLTLETLPWNTTAKITQQVYGKWSWKGTVVFMFNRLPFINFSGEYKDFYYEGN